MSVIVKDEFFQNNNNNNKRRKIKTTSRLQTVGYRSQVPCLLHFDSFGVYEDICATSTDATHDTIVK